MTLNLQRAASELAEKIAALPARYPYIGAAEKNAYLFTPTEVERDLIVQALCAFAAAPLGTGVHDESATTNTHDIGRHHTRISHNSAAASVLHGQRRHRKDHSLACGKCCPAGQVPQGQICSWGDRVVVSAVG